MIGDVSTHNLHVFDLPLEIKNMNCPMMAISDPKVIVWRYEDALCHSSSCCFARV